MDISSKNSKIIIILVVILAVGLIIIFGLKKRSRQNNIVESPESIKEELINDDMSDPAVSKDDVENQEFNPALDDANPDIDNNNPDDIIEDPETERL